MLEVHWFQDGETLLTCSSDKTVRAWDVEAGSQVKRLKEHTAIVNSVCPLRRGPQLFVSGADDGAVKVWDMRVKRSVGSFKDKFPVCAVAFADAGDQVYSAGVDNTIKVRARRSPSIHACMQPSMHASARPSHGSNRAGKGMGGRTCGAWRCSLVWLLALGQKRHACT